MSLYLGHSLSKSETPQEPKKIFRYTLNYPTSALNTALYSIRESSGGYRYMSMEGFTDNTTLTLQQHTFSTDGGRDIVECTVTYSIEVMNKLGNYSYYNLETLDLMTLKVPKKGGRFNIFSLNKEYTLSRVMNTTNISDSVMFSVYFTQTKGTVSGSTSMIDLYVSV